MLHVHVHGVPACLPKICVSNVHNLYIHVYKVLLPSFALYSSSSSSGSDTDDSSGSSSTTSDQYSTNGKKSKRGETDEVSSLFLKVTGLANRPGRLSQEIRFASVLTIVFICRASPTRWFIL